MLHLVALVACTGSDHLFRAPLPMPPSVGEVDPGIEHVRARPGALEGYHPWPEPEGHPAPEPEEPEEAEEPEEPEEPEEEPAGPEEAEGPTDGDRLYADGALHDLWIELSADAIASLRLAPTVEVPAMLTWEGEPQEVALRIKGNRSERTIDQKPAFKIDVHELVDFQRIDGEKRLTLNNMVQDGSMLREHAYYRLSERMGLPAPRHAYARVWVNGEAYGLYGLVETMDVEFIERAFDGDEGGNLYEGAHAADFTYAKDWFELDRDGGLLDAPDDIEDLVDAVEASRTGDRAAMLAANFDLDAALTYWALDIVSGNPDGYVFNHHNYHVYHAPLADRWTLLPWGTDQSFVKEDVPPTGDLENPVEGELVIACLSDVGCASALTTRIAEVLTVWEDELPDFVDATADRIADACEADPRREDPCDPDEVRDFVRRRPAFLRDFL